MLHGCVQSSSTTTTPRAPLITSLIDYVMASLFIHLITYTTACRHQVQPQHRGDCRCHPWFRTAWHIPPSLKISCCTPLFDHIVTFLFIYAITCTTACRHQVHQVLLQHHGHFQCHPGSSRVHQHHSRAPNHGSQCLLQCCHGIVHWER